MDTTKIPPPSQGGNHYLWKPFPTKPWLQHARLDAAESQRENILLFHIANGVNIESRTVQIEEGVVIAPGATILAGTIPARQDGHRRRLRHRPQQPDSRTAPWTRGTTVNASQVYGSHLGPLANIGPFTTPCGG